MPDITAVTHAQNIRYDRKAEALYIIDQTLLPGEEKEIRLQTIDEMVEAIRALRVRGAPAIGICAAYCMYVLAKSIRTEDRPTFLRRLSDYGQQLEASRPTAVNLGWAIREMMRTALEHVHDTRGQMLDALYERAVVIHEDDIAKCKAISEYGLSLLKEGDGVLTHCNAGPLATSRYGTAQGPFLLAAERGMHIRVFADETRPLLQGARLTAYELVHDHIPATLIADNMAASLMAKGKIDLAVIHYPRISNFTDFDVFEQMPEVSVRYVTNVRELGTPDLIFLPGSKNTMGDLKWMRQNGLEAAVKRAAGKVPIFGICGGYQMLGCEIADPDSVEEGGRIRGMELLPVRTVLQKEKHRCQIDGKLEAVEGIFAGLTGYEFTGYEIHMGVTTPLKQCSGLAELTAQDGSKKSDGMTNGTNVYGSYVHGLFDSNDVLQALSEAFSERKGIHSGASTKIDLREYKERQYDQLAEALRTSLNMDEIYRIIREGV